MNCCSVCTQTTIFWALNSRMLRASDYTQWMVETHIAWIENMTFNLLQIFSSPQLTVNACDCTAYIYYKSYYNLIDWFRKYCQIAVVVVVEEKINNTFVRCMWWEKCVRVSESAFEVKCPHIWALHSHTQMFCFFVEFFFVALSITLERFVVFIWVWWLCAKRQYGVHIPASPFV